MWRSWWRNRSRSKGERTMRLLCFLEHRYEERETGSSLSRLALSDKRLKRPDSVETDATRCGWVDDMV